MNKIEKPYLIALNAAELQQTQGGFPITTSLWPLASSCVVKVVDGIGTVCEPLISPTQN